MAGLTGPLFSLSARGTIAKTITYASWRGINYARERVIPANPQTTAQTEVRNIFAMLLETWKRAPALFQTPWTAHATGQPFTNRNALIRDNMVPLQGEADMQNFVWSPGALGGLAPLTSVVTPGSGTLSFAIGAPALPTGWTIQGATAAAFQDGNPDAVSFFDITAGEDLSDPFVVLLSSLPNTLHVVGAWLRWVRPDAQIAYSTAISGTATPAA